MGRDLIELSAADESVFFEFSQGLGQHGVGDAGQGLFQLSEAYGIVDAHFVHELGFPAALQHEEQGRYRTVAVSGHDAFFYPDQVLFISHIFTAHLAFLPG